MYVCMYVRLCSRIVIQSISDPTPSSMYVCMYVVLLSSHVSGRFVKRRHRQKESLTQGVRNTAWEHLSHFIDLSSARRWEGEGICNFLASN